MQINKALFITLSNIGDVILTLPALDYLRESFPRAKITVVCGLRPKDIFQGNPAIEKLIVYDKRCRLKEKIDLFKRLKREGFDAVIDLRNSFFGACLPAKYKTSPFSAVPAHIKHMSQRHLYKVMQALGRFQDAKIHYGMSLNIRPEDEGSVSAMLKQSGITEKDRIVVFASGARSQTKKWPGDSFINLGRAIAEEFSLKVILVGDKDDQPANKYILENLRYPVLDLSAKTTLSELAFLLKRAAFLVTCDSAVLHLASYLNRPVVAIFGPTDPEKYGPWSEVFRLVKKDIICRPCQGAQCRLKTLDCLKFVRVEDVMRQVKDMLVTRSPSQSVSLPEGDKVTSLKDEFRRILIVRTDRIGDVLLSTPVIKAMRENYPHAYIAMMVSPYAKDIVEGNPYLDQVIIYDKDGKHKSWRRCVRFALNLKKKRFDLALVLHPTNRVHLVSFFAGITRRVGYDRKLGFLLTDRITHEKHLGQKHELEYNLDLLRYLGIQPQDKTLYMPLRQDCEEWANGFLKEQGIKATDELLAIHPGASCISKIWPLERFAWVADRLADKYGFKVLIIAGPKDVPKAQEVSKKMLHKAINLAGQISVSQLASLLKRCRLFISNDSGPVHIASSLGTPVISIFGRSQRGLSPLRWGPVGKYDRFAQKSVGCVECLAHNCPKDFLCLKAVSADYVLNIADSILKG